MICQQVAEDPARLLHGGPLVVGRLGRRGLFEQLLSFAEPCVNCVDWRRVREVLIDPIGEPSLPQAVAKERVIERRGDRME